MGADAMELTTLAEAPRYWFLNAQHILLARNRNQLGAYSLVHLTGPAGFATPYHVHHTEDEAFYLLDGELTVICDGRKVEMKAGSYAFLPRGVPHGFRSTGQKESQLLIHVIPGGDVGFIGMMLEMGMAFSPGASPEVTPIDGARLKAVCEKNQIEILGPLPA